MTCCGNIGDITDFAKIQRQREWVAVATDDRLWLFYVFTKQVKEDTILAEYNGPLDAVDAYTHSVGYDILLSNVVLVAIPFAIGPHQVTYEPVPR
eukprot:scaffold5777_cov144-Skeletonema_dohrnii-CCMP3373.AAC.3